MISFKQFLSEAEVEPMAPGEPIADEDLLDFLDEHCSAALAMVDAGGPVLYRGFSKNQQLSVLDPSTGTRKSENTTNWYTSFFDTNPANAAWPKRSKSFICSTHKSRASSYSDGGQDSVAILLPFDGVSVAEILADDMWSVRPVIHGLETSYTRMNSAFSGLFQTSKVLTYEEAKSRINGMSDDELYQTFMDNSFSFLAADSHRTARIKVEDQLNRDKSFARVLLNEILEKFYTLDNMNRDFKLHSGMGAQTDQHECWFAGKCVVVPQSKWSLIR